MSRQLAAFVQDALDKQGLNAYQASRRCGVSNDSMYRLLRGSPVGPKILSGVADGLRLPLRTLRELAGLDAEAPRQVQLPREFAHLSDANRRLLITIGWRLLASQGIALPDAAVDDVPALQEPTPTSPAVDDHSSEPRRVTRAVRRRSN